MKIFKTVKDLIKELQAIEDQDLPVVTYSDDLNRKYVPSIEIKDPDYSGWLYSDMRIVLIH